MAGGFIIGLHDLWGPEQLVGYTFHQSLQEDVAALGGQYAEKTLGFGDLVLRICGAEVTVCA